MTLTHGPWPVCLGELFVTEVFGDSVMNINPTIHQESNLPVWTVCKIATLSNDTLHFIQTGCIKWQGSCCLKLTACFIFKAIAFSITFKCREKTQLFLRWVVSLRRADNDFELDSHSKLFLTFFFLKDFTYVIYLCLYFRATEIFCVPLPLFYNAFFRKLQSDPKVWICTLTLFYLIVYLTRQ